MFSTMKVNDSNTGLKTLKVRNSIKGKRQGPFTQNACSHCREKKLRCSGEERGCQRCLSKGIECIYQSSSSARQHAAGTRVVESTETTEAPRPGEITFALEKDSNMADNGPADDMFFDEMLGVDFSFLEEELAGASVDPPDSMRCIDGTQAGANHSALVQQIETATNHVDDISFVSQPGVSLQQSPETRQAPDRRASATAVPNTDTSSQGIMGRDYSGGVTEYLSDRIKNTYENPQILELMALNAGSQHQYSRNCMCTTNLLLAYEDISIHLAGKVLQRAQRTNFTCLEGMTSLGGGGEQTFGPYTNDTTESAPVDMTLQCLKRTLTRCEEFVGCQSCGERSECFMMSISICDTMLSSVEQVAGAVHKEDTTISSTPHIRSGTSGDNISPHSLSSEHPHGPSGGMTRGHSASTSSDKSQSGKEPSGSYSRDVRLGLKIGKWQLDNDDERQVIQSLLAARIVRLSRLLAQIQHAVQLNEWPIHEALVSRVQERLVGAKLRKRGVSFF